MLYSTDSCQKINQLQYNGTDQHFKNADEIRKIPSKWIS
jgi:hypothetical protein